jgi:hypothetical protein
MPLNLIPQIFYDLISRVIPGTVLLISWYISSIWLIKDPKFINGILANKSLFNFWHVSSFFILSYIL